MLFFAPGVEVVVVAWFWFEGFEGFEEFEGFDGVFPSLNGLSMVGLLSFWVIPVPFFAKYHQPPSRSSRSMRSRLQNSHALRLRRSSSI